MTAMMKRASMPRRAALAAAALAAIMSVAGTSHAAGPIEDVIAFDRAGTPLPESKRIAYLAECAQNTYCQARVRGMEDAAKKFNFEFKLFDANFNPAEQLKQVQNATAEGFDGYILGPTAAMPACNMWRQFLQGTDKPVVTVDLPMCGDIAYTEGLAGTVTMQGQPFFDSHVDNAFASCDGKPCKAIAVGGFVGSDLYNLWVNAIKNGKEKHPNVDVVVEQPANYDPRKTLQVVQDALRLHPDADLVISPWDDMTRGALQAIESVGKTPGKDVRIYSVGGTKDAVEKVKAGQYNGTTILLPYEESYYGGVAMVMALMGKAPMGYINEAELPVVTDGPGSIFITKENADSFSPNY